MASFSHTIAWLLLPVGAASLGGLSPFESCSGATLALFVPLALVLKRARPVSGFLAGWLFGAVVWAAGTLWVVNGLESLMDVPDGLIWPAAVVLWLYQGLPFAVLGLICGWMNLRGRSPGPLFCASLLTALIYLRPPLCPVSSAVSVALWPGFIQVADLGGEFLVLFCLLLINWLLADALSRLVQGDGPRAVVRAATACMLLAVVLGYGEWRLSEYRDAAAHSDAGTLSIATVQPNVPARWGKGAASLKDFATDEALCLQCLSSHAEQVRNAGLVVFPELPRFDCQGREFVGSGLATALQRQGIPALLPSEEHVYAANATHVQLGGDVERFITSRPILAKYNSVFFLPSGADRPQLAYRKTRLVPFSEATPLRDTFPRVRNAGRESLEVSEGAGLRLIRLGGLNIQPLICFESGFAGLVRQGVAKGADVLVEVSNDSWFASPDVEAKHLGMGIFRSVEMRRPLVRCSNSGNGAHVQASGEIVPGTRTQHGRACVARATVYCPAVLTPYLRQGDSWLWGLALIVAWRMASMVARPTSG